MAIFDSYELSICLPLINCNFMMLLFVPRQSYDVNLEMRVEGTTMRTSNSLDLKNPYFRYTGQPAQAPPGTSHTSPSEAYWSQLDAQGARQGK